MLLALLQNLDMLGAVNLPPTLLDQLPNVSVGYSSGTYTYELGDSFANADSYAISPVVEAGWSFDTGTGQLTMDTDAEGTFGPYIVTATNTNGDTPSNEFTVTVALIDVRPRFRIRRFS